MKRSSVFIMEVDEFNIKHTIHVRPSKVSENHVYVDIIEPANVLGGAIRVRMGFTKKGFIGFLDETKRMLEGKT